MLQDVIFNNRAEIMGTILGDFCFSHEVYGESFYSFIVRVKRLSDMTDDILVTASEKLDLCRFHDGDEVYITGQYRSYNNYSNVGNKLILTVFAKEIAPAAEEHADRNTNFIYLNGFICKEPIFRTTPFGREITDTLLAVNRTYSKSDYIPCIAWGRNARITAGLPVGTNLIVFGRVQSREYQKKLSETNIVNKIAYEVSVSKIEIGSASLPCDSTAELP